MAVKPPFNQPAIRITMLPRDTNPEGSIFGGVILSLIDQASAVEALRQARHHYVTKAMDAIEFLKPVHIGDVVSLWATTKHVGRTSIRIHVDVLAQAPDAHEARKVTEADVTMVALDDHGKPTPVFTT
ncbi:MAG: acyl-CoA thioesterase [Phycisphaerae bacterium]|nr:acyl-CoA thioesterase [Phycisphaerae bacterium]